MTDTLHSFGLGIATLNREGALIETWYPAPMLHPDPGVTRAAGKACGYSGGNRAIVLEPVQLEALEKAISDSGDEHSRQLVHALQSAARPIVATFLATDEAPASVAEVYLKLHLLSHRLCQPHTLNLRGAFGVLHNIAWTSEGPIDLPELPQRQLQARLAGRALSVDAVDKFPKMSDYVIPPGIRIADTARGGRGAHGGEGTTVMHEGFINFNAGTLGPAMIEGRISAGVVIGEGSDLGGGCSTMGTLSGGGKEVISVGRDCLIGANAGIGIALGDRCVVEAGLYITAGTKLQLMDRDNQPVRTVKARELSGHSDLLFRRNSTTGGVECRANSTQIELNEELHRHN
ncbi:MAG: 2,3,4,5-tetrahydropyridine-2,6-dicarboxylate N-succinyltransferase [Pseudohongiellaceae bacterium]